MVRVPSDKYKFLESMFIEAGSREDFKHCVLNEVLKYCCVSCWDWYLPEYERKDSGRCPICGPDAERYVQCGECLRVCHEFEMASNGCLCIDCEEWHKKHDRRKRH